MNLLTSKWLPASLCAAFSLLAVPIATVSAAEIANSINDWDPAGGQTGWQYGYYNYTLDLDDTYAADEFLPFSNEFGAGGGAVTPLGNHWTGTAWDMEGGATGPWTFVAAENAHPNGTNSVPNEEHWAIRRWNADVASEMGVGITWKLRAQNTNGTGTSCELYVDGEKKDAFAVAGNDAVGVERTVFVNISPMSTIDLALTPVGPTDDRSDGADGSFFSFIVDDEVGDVECQADGTVFVSASAVDDDMDDLPDSWEANFSPGDPNLLSGLDGADSDMDGLSDLEELMNKSDPTEGDTDGDGLGDREEVEDLGTSPSDADTDGDGLDDGDEINTHGTDPTLADSDGDGFDDGEETGAGTDPNDDTSKPVLADSITEFSGIQGQDGWNYGYRNLTVDAGVRDSYDVENDFIAFVGGSEDLAPFDGVIQQWRPDIWDLRNPSNSSGPWTELAQENTHPNGINSAPNEEHWTIRRWTADEISTTTPLGLIWHMRKTNTNGLGVTGSLYINGEQVDTQAIAGNDNVGVTRTWYANLVPGDIIDLALTPVGPDGNDTDGSDGSANWLRIDARIPDDPRQPDGTPFEEDTGQPFAITNITVVGSELTVTFPSRAGQSYILEFADDPNGLWLEETDGVTDAMETTTDPIDLGDPIPARKFARIRILE